MPSEMMFLRQMLAGGSANYLPIAMLSGLLLAAIFRPKQIRCLGMFRTACVLLAVSVGLGPTLLACMVSLGMPNNMGGVPSLAYPIIEAVGSVLLAISICLGIFSLLPSSDGEYETLAPKHPMDS